MAKILEIRLKSLAKFKRLLALEAEQARIAEEIEELKAELLPVVRSYGAVACDDAKFVVQARSRWKFSAKVAELEGRTKAQKQYEIENHIARKLAPIEFIKINKG